MSIYDLMNNFWLVNERDPCSLSEIALQHYLFFEANRQHWVMPFKVNTQMIQARLNTSKQNVMKARDGLARKGLISFSKGEGKGKPALYTLLLGAEDKTDTQQLPHSLPQSLTQKMPQTLSDGLTQMLPHSNIQDDNTKDVETKEPIVTPSPSSAKVVLTLAELKEKLLSDDVWKKELSERLAKNGLELQGETLDGRIVAFFDMLEQKGLKGKEEADCRNYVFNWIMYNKNKIYNNGQDSRSKSKVGLAEISANRPEDYKGCC